MKHLKRISAAIVCAVVITTLVALPALAHDGPEGAEWVMADWMFITFAVFAGGALIAFVLCLKAGLLSNMEEAKYHILTIDEPDYYSSNSYAPGIRSERLFGEIAANASLLHSIKRKG